MIVKNRGMRGYINEIRKLLKAAACVTHFIKLFDPQVQIASPMRRASSYPRSEIQATESPNPKARTIVHQSRATTGPGSVAEIGVWICMIVRSLLYVRVVPKALSRHARIAPHCNSFLTGSQMGAAIQARQATV
jgi:hypothetical protein